MPDGDHQQLSREVTIVNALGLHARPAARIAAIAGRTHRRVWLAIPEDEVNAKSTMDILMLNRPRGSKVTIRIEDIADRHILTAIARLIHSGFGEPE